MARNVMVPEMKCAERLEETVRRHNNRATETVQMTLPGREVLRS